MLSDPPPPDPGPAPTGAAVLIAALPRTTVIEEPG